MDAYEICKPDVLWDANKVPLPFKDEQFDLILANHILEHLPNWWGCFCDCARILRTGGTIQIYLPGEASDSQMGYRDHVSYINQNSFYGTLSMRRPGSNAWAAQEKHTDVERMKCVYMGRVINSIGWIKYVPKFLHSWCGEHLRNFVSENVYYFVKVSKEEFENTRGIEWDKR
jgi:SAM-dependent methyltransferase